MLPQPVAALTGGCTVIFDNTLYSYSADGFQSLKLEEGAVWKKLPSGTSVKEGVCVGATPKDPSSAGLFIVGGESSEKDYAGLQKFTYSTGKWETITPQVPVTKDRVYHSAAYINSTESILVYAGSTDGNPDLSQQTFTVSTSEPYRVLAYQSDASQPGVAPLLLPWSETQVALIGGNPWNTEVMLFDATAVGADGVVGAWINSGATLAAPLPKNTTSVKGTIIQADDGSKHLFTFDPTTSPNTVNRTVLVGADGAPVTFAAPFKPRLQGEQKDREVIVDTRDLTVNNWPPYNSTLAPTVTRTDYSLATNPDGLVVISGGNDDDVLSLFNVKENSWEDAEKVLGGGSFTAQTISPSDTPEPTATSTPSASPHASSSTKHKLSQSAVLGITLGSIFAAIILLTALLFLLKSRQRKQKHTEVGRARRASGMPEKGPFHANPAQISSGYSRGHGYQDSQSSFSSMAIFLGKSQTTQRKGSNDKGQASSDGSSARPKIGRPQPQNCTQPAFITIPEKEPLPPQATQPGPRPRQTVDSYSAPRRSSGWNRYWSGASTSILGFGSKSRPDTEFSDESSRYSDTYRLTLDSARVPPLQVAAEGRPSFQHVHSASPTVSQITTVPEAQSCQIEERPVSPISDSASAISDDTPPSDDEDTMGYTKPKKPWDSTQAPSSAYSSGIHDGSHAASSPTVTVTSPANNGISQQPQLDVASMSTDMSWLNLGDTSSSNYTGQKSRS